MSNEYFLNNLNYSMANEDTSLERSIALSLKPRAILTVCGSGSRVFPLMSEGTTKMDIIDMSEIQLSFAKLRENSFNELNYVDFLDFWGYRNIDNEKRKKIYFNLVKNSNEKLLNLFNESNWDAPIYYGGWEKTYQKLNKLVQLFLGKKLINQIMNVDSLEKQLDIFKKFVFQLRWKSVLLIVGNKTLFNSLLYKGKFIKKNLPVNYIKFYINAFERLFNKVLIKDSYFLQMSFIGHLKYESGLPTEAKKDTFNEIKNKISSTSIKYIQDDLISYLGQGSTQYDFLSLSDVPSYFNDELGSDFLQQISPSVCIGGIIVVRYYLRVYEPNLNGYEDITTDYKIEIDQELVQMYKVKIYKRVI